MDIAAPPPAEQAATSPPDPAVPPSKRNRTDSPLRPPSPPSTAADSPPQPSAPPAEPHPARHSPAHSLSSFLQSSPSPDPEPPILQPLPEPPAATIINRAEKLESAGVDAEKGSRVVSWILRRRKRGEKLARAAILSRLAALVLSLVSFSVMAANRTKGWAGDSFDRYMEYRFCVTVNVLTFIYSAFQAYAQVYRLVYGKNIIRLPARLYFDLAMDQVLAYLLIAAAASAATRNNDWITNWGNDPFTVIANGSISVAFLAFAAVAISALISAFALFGDNS